MHQPINKPIRLMIDMETPASSKQTAPLTLGCVQFDLPFGMERPSFYERASLASIESKGFAVSRATMEWWDKQDPAVRNEAFGGILDITELLDSFSQWVMRTFNCTDCTGIELWSRGAGFDCEILQHCYEECFGTYPFDFRKHMCQRTVQALMPAELTSLVTRTGAKHNALDDAINQADMMDVALRNLRWGR